MSQNVISSAFRRFLQRELISVEVSTLRRPRLAGRALWTLDDVYSISMLPQVCGVDYDMVHQLVLSQLDRQLTSEVGHSAELGVMNIKNVIGMDALYHRSRRLASTLDMKITLCVDMPPPADGDHRDDQPVKVDDVRRPSQTATCHIFLRSAWGTGHRENNNKKSLKAQHQGRGAEAAPRRLDACSVGDNYVGWVNAPIGPKMYQTLLQKAARRAMRCLEEEQMRELRLAADECALSLRCLSGYLSSSSTSVAGSDTLLPIERAKLANIVAVSNQASPSAAEAKRVALRMKFLDAFENISEYAIPVQCFAEQRFGRILHGRNSSSTAPAPSNSKSNAAASYGDTAAAASDCDVIAPREDVLIPLTFAGAPHEAVTSDAKVFTSSPSSQDDSCNKLHSSLPQLKLRELPCFTLLDSGFGRGEVDDDGSGPDLLPSLTQEHVEAVVSCVWGDELFCAARRSICPSFVLSSPRHGSFNPMDMMPAIGYDNIWRWCREASLGASCAADDDGSRVVTSSSLEDLAMLLPRLRIENDNISGSVVAEMMSSSSLFDYRREASSGTSFTQLLRPEVYGSRDEDWNNNNNAFAMLTEMLLFTRGWKNISRFALPVQNTATPLVVTNAIQVRQQRQLGGGNVVVVEDKAFPSTVDAFSTLFGTSLPEQIVAGENGQSSEQRAPSSASQPSAREVKGRWCTPEHRGSRDVWQLELMDFNAACRQVAIARITRFAGSVVALAPNSDVYFRVPLYPAEDVLPELMKKLREQLALRASAAAGGGEATGGGGYSGPTRKIIVDMKRQSIKTITANLTGACFGRRSDLSTASIPIVYAGGCFLLRVLSDTMRIPTRLAGYVKSRALLVGLATTCIISGKCANAGKSAATTAQATSFLDAVDEMFPPVTGLQLIYGIEAKVWTLRKNGYTVQMDVKPTAGVESSPAAAEEKTNLFCLRVSVKKQQRRHTTEEKMVQMDGCQKPPASAASTPTSTASGQHRESVLQSPAASAAGASAEEELWKESDNELVRSIENELIADNDVTLSTSPSSSLPDTAGVENDEKEDEMEIAIELQGDDAGIPTLVTPDGRSAIQALMSSLDEIISQLASNSRSSPSSASSSPFPQWQGTATDLPHPLNGWKFDRINAPDIESSICHRVFPMHSVVKQGNGSSALFIDFSPFGKYASSTRSCVSTLRLSLPPSPPGGIGGGAEEKRRHASVYAEAIALHFPELALAVKVMLSICAATLPFARMYHHIRVNLDGVEKVKDDQNHDSSHRSSSSPSLSLEDKFYCQLRASVTMDKPVPTASSLASSDNQQPQPQPIVPEDEKKAPLVITSSSSSSTSTSLRHHLEDVLRKVQDVEMPKVEKKRRNAPTRPSLPALLSALYSIIISASSSQQQQPFEDNSMMKKENMQESPQLLRPVATLFPSQPVPSSPHDFSLAFRTVDENDVSAGQGVAGADPRCLMTLELLPPLEHSSSSSSPIVAVKGWSSDLVDLLANYCHRVVAAALSRNAVATEALLRKAIFVDSEDEGTGGSSNPEHSLVNRLWELLPFAREGANGLLPPHVAARDVFIRNINAKGIPVWRCSIPIPPAFWKDLFPVTNCRVEEKGAIKTEVAGSNGASGMVFSLASPSLVSKRAALQHIAAALIKSLAPPPVGKSSSGVMSLAEGQARDHDGGSGDETAARSSLLGTFVDALLAAGCSDRIVSTRLVVDDDGNWVRMQLIEIIKAPLSPVDEGGGRVLFEVRREELAMREAMAARSSFVNVVWSGATLDGLTCLFEHVLSRYRQLAPVSDRTLLVHSIKFPVDPMNYVNLIARYFPEVNSRSRVDESPVLGGSWTVSNALSQSSVRALFREIQTVSSLSEGTGGNKKCSVKLTISAHGKSKKEAARHLTFVMTQKIFDIEGIAPSTTASTFTFNTITAVSTPAPHGGTAPAAEISAASRSTIPPPPSTPLLRNSKVVASTPPRIGQKQTNPIRAPVAAVPLSVIQEGEELRGPRGPEVLTITKEEKLEPSLMQLLLCDLYDMHPKKLPLAGPNSVGGGGVDADMCGTALATWYEVSHLLGGLAVLAAPRSVTSSPPTGQTPSFVQPAVCLATIPLDAWQLTTLENLLASIIYAWARDRKKRTSSSSLVERPETKLRVVIPRRPASAPPFRHESLFVRRCLMTLFGFPLRTANDDDDDDDDADGIDQQERGEEDNGDRDVPHVQVLTYQLTGSSASAVEATSWRSSAVLVLPQGDRRQQRGKAPAASEKRMLLVAQEGPTKKASRRQMMARLSELVCPRTLCLDADSADLSQNGGINKEISSTGIEIGEERLITWAEKRTIR